VNCEAGKFSTPGPEVSGPDGDKSHQQESDQHKRYLAPCHPGLVEQTGQDVHDPHVKEGTGSQCVEKRLEYSCIFS